MGRHSTTVAESSLSFEWRLGSVGRTTAVRLEVSDGVIDTAIGTGRSVDHVCSVWRREVRAPTTVMLGALSRDDAAPLPPLRVERSMYGVVATPLPIAHADGAR